jgi:hypothetical protein
MTDDLIARLRRVWHEEELEAQAARIVALENEVAALSVEATQMHTLRQEQAARIAELENALRDASTQPLSDARKFDIEVALRELLSACDKVLDVVNTYGNGSERVTFDDAIDDARAVLAAAQGEKP